MLLWNVGIDYLSVAAYDDLIPSHLVLLEDRVRKSLFDLPCLTFRNVLLILPSILIEHNIYGEDSFFELQNLRFFCPTVYIVWYFIVWVYVRDSCEISEVDSLSMKLK